jgi:hypothetical protein
MGWEDASLIGLEDTAEVTDVSDMESRRLRHNVHGV